MFTPSSTWSVVLAFAPPSPRPSDDSARQASWFEAACLDTLDAVAGAVEPRCLTVITSLPAVAAAAQQVGAKVGEPGRDLNTAVTAAMARRADAHPERSGLILVGPLPYATTDILFAMLRACAATEAAVVTADDGGTVALSHHDPKRLAPRFGGASGSRHARASVVVAQHLDGLQRTVDAGRGYPGSRLAALASRPAASPTAATAPHTAEDD